MKKIKFLSSLFIIFLLIANSTIAKNFSDVDTNNSSYIASRYLSEKGIINGYTDGTFRPDQAITRAELLKIIFEGNKTKTTNPNTNCFPDVGYKEWYSPYICTAKNLKIINGYDDGNFKPNQTVNNAEGLKILGEFYKWNATNKPVEPWYEPFVNFGKTANLLDNPDNFEPNQAATRGGMSSILYHYLAIKEYQVDKFSADINNKIAIKINAEDVANNNNQPAATSNPKVVSRNLTTPEIVQLAAGEIKIVLSWEDVKIPPQQEKTQFNSYLLQPTDEEISFQHKIDSKFDTILETKDNSETFTLRNLKPDNNTKNYLYFTESLNGKTTFNEAKMQADIYDKNGLVISISAYEDPGRIWKIFTLDENYELRIFNTIGDCSLINRNSTSCPQIDSAQQGGSATPAQIPLPSATPSDTPTTIEGI